MTSSASGLPATGPWLVSFLVYIYIFLSLSLSLYVCVYIYARLSIYVFIYDLDVSLVNKCVRDVSRCSKYVLDGCLEQTHIVAGALQILTGLCLM